MHTPLLMMHNDHDGAVPWCQGVEYFMVLRRLGQSVWILNYADKPHWVITKANQKGYDTGMQQFFDHYLRGAPAPEKHRRLDLDLQAVPEQVAQQ